MGRECRLQRKLKRVNSQRLKEFGDVTRRVSTAFLILASGERRFQARHKT
jgi:hypothetical protein